MGMRTVVGSTALTFMLAAPALVVAGFSVDAQEAVEQVERQRGAGQKARKRSAKPSQQPAQVAIAENAKPSQEAVRIPRTPEAEAARPKLEEDRGVAVTRTTITSDALQSSNAQNTFDAIRNVPGVALADARGGGTADSLQIRGIKLSSTTSYRMDGGLPIVNNINLPIESKQRVEALKGAGALQFGLASPAGIVNYVMKRATDKPVTSLSVSGSEHGQLIGAVDVGRRFGEDNQFGVRVNLAGGELGSFVRGIDGTRYVAAIGADWRPADNLNFIFDYERFGVDVIEQAAILQNPAVNGRITLPNVPNPANLLSGTWARSIGEGENIFGRGTWDVGSGLSIIAEAGRSIGFRPQRAVTQIGNYNVVTGAGRLSATLIENQLTENIYANLAARHRSEWGFIKNETTIGMTESIRMFNNPQNPTASWAQNLYDPVYIPPPVAASGRQFLPNNSENFDLYIQNQIDFFDRLHVLGGVRQINYTSENARRDGNGFNSRSSTAYAPAAGIIFDITKQISIYASYVSSLEENGQAPAQAANAFSVLPPAPATQKEIGIRGNFFGAQATLGAFSILRSNATLDPVTNIFGLNGNIEYNGVEFTVARPITAELSFNAGGQFMKAKQIAPDDASIDGMTPENTPFFSGNAGLVYRPDWFKGFRINGGVSYTGERQINPQNQAAIPETYIWNMGASYATKIGDQRVNFNLNVRNITDKRYFSSAVNGALGVGAPRTITLSANVAF